jgi:hypothetical protein
VVQRKGLLYAGEKVTFHVKVENLVRIKVKMDGIPGKNADGILQPLPREAKVEIYASTSVVRLAMVDNRPQTRRK